MKKMRRFKKMMTQPGKGRKKGDSGYTLIDLILAILLMGFALGGLIILFFNLSVGSIHGKYRATANLLAQELVEEIKSKKFDEKAAPSGGVWSTTLGVDGGESSSDKTTFDDVDDFDGWNEALTGAFSGYSRQAAVSFVDSSALNTAVGSSRDYKRVQTTVSKGGVNYAVMTTLITPTRNEAP
jgi:MSHA pilin protein MshD